LALTARGTQMVRGIATGARMSSGPGVPDGAVENRRTPGDLLGGSGRSRSSDTGYATLGSVARETEPSLSLPYYQTPAGHVNSVVFTSHRRRGRRLWMQFRDPTLGRGRVRGQSSLRSRQPTRGQPAVGEESLHSGEWRCAPRRHYIASGGEGRAALPRGLLGGQSRKRLEPDPLTYVPLEKCSPCA
jgi:hypothetical protein